MTHNEGQACREGEGEGEGFGSPPGPHEAASKAARKPRSTAAGRSEGHALALPHRPENLRRTFFVYVRLLDGAVF